MICPLLSNADKLVNCQKEQCMLFMSRQDRDVCAIAHNAEFVEATYRYLVRTHSDEAIK